MASLLTSVDVPQKEKEIAKKTAIFITNLFASFDNKFITERIKSLLNAINSFQKNDPKEFIDRKRDFQRYGELLDGEFKLFVKQLGKALDMLRAIKDDEINKIESNIMINVDNISELLIQLYSLFRNPGKDFKQVVTKKLVEIVSRSEDFIRILKEEFVDHLLVDIAAVKNTFSSYEADRIKRGVIWLS